MTFDYLTNAFGLSSEPLLKRKPKRLSFDRLVSGEQTLLSRGLCSFESRPLPQNLSGEKRLQALELAARTASPYDDPGIFILVDKMRAAIWTYDAEKIRQIDGVALRKIIPESALHAPSNGAVLRQVLEGSEGQYWSDGELVASRWWPSGVSEAEWQRFCLSAERYGAQGEQIPELELPEKRKTVPVNSLPFTSSLNLVAMKAWMGLFGSILAFTILFFGVRLMYLNYQSAQMQSEYETLWQDKSEERQQAVTLNALNRKSASVADLFSGRHPLPALGVALSAALQNQAQITTIFYDGYIFEVGFSTSSSFDQRGFVADLEQSSFISRVNLVQGQRADLWELTFSHGAMLGEQE